MPETEETRIKRYLRLLSDIFYLAPLAVFILFPEVLRMVACKLNGQEYRSPTARILDGMEVEDSD